MSSLILILGLVGGIAFYRLVLRTPVSRRLAAWGTRLSLTIVLLGLGISLGSEAVLWSQLKRIGGIACLFALANGLGSALLVRMVFGRQEYEK